MIVSSLGTKDSNGSCLSAAIRTIIRRKASDTVRRTFGALTL